MLQSNGKLSSLGHAHVPAYEDGAECSETSAYKIQTPGESPKRKHTAFRTGRKFMG